LLLLLLLLLFIFFVTVITANTVLYKIGLDIETLTRCINIIVYYSRRIRTEFRQRASNVPLSKIIICVEVARRHRANRISASDCCTMSRVLLPTCTIGYTQVPTTVVPNRRTPVRMLFTKTFNVFFIMVIFLFDF